MAADQRPSAELNRHGCAPSADHSVSDFPRLARFAHRTQTAGGEHRSGRWPDGWGRAIRQTEAMDALGGGPETQREQAGSLARGVVKFYRAEKGWGGIESEMTPDDVWFHFSDIEGAGYRSLEAGEPVEFRWVPARQDSWNCRATWVRPLPGK